MEVWVVVRDGGGNPIIGVASREGKAVGLAVKDASDSPVGQSIEVLQREGRTFAIRVGEFEYRAAPFDVDT